jgi:hypothetical protein
MRNTWLRWAGLSLCYLAFAGSLSRAEGVAAVLTGGFAAALSAGLRRRAKPALALRGRWAGVLARQAVQLVCDIATVGATLVRVSLRGRGHRGEVTLDTDAAQRPVGARAGRRAAAALLASLTPDTVALETGDGAVPIHRLSRASAAARRGRREP